MIVAYCLRLTFCRFIVSFVRSPYKFRYSPFLDVSLSSVLAFSGPRNDRRVAMYKRPTCTSLQTSECSASAASLQTSLNLRNFPFSHLLYCLELRRRTELPCRRASELRSPLLSPLSLFSTAFAISCCAARPVQHILPPLRSPPRRTH